VIAATVREQFCGHVIYTETREHAIMEETFSVRSVPRLYNEDQHPLRHSLETAVTRVGGSCDAAANLRTRGLRSRGTSAVESVVRSEKPVAEAGNSLGI
jgi:hypothetical protein